jgi:hypothetical protein
MVPMLILRFFLMIALSVMLALGGCTASDSSKEQKIAVAKKIAEDRQAAAKLIVNNLARKSDAIVDWKEQLGSTDFAVLNRIYTVDVERVWTAKKPILFIGVLDDVASEDQKNYQLFIRDYGFFFPETRLHLICPKEAVDPLLAAVKKDKESIYAGGIAVTARIVKVEHQMSFDDKGTKHIFVGHGQCVDLVHIGDALNF